MYHVVRRVWHWVVGGVDEEEGGGGSVEVGVGFQGFWRVV